MPDAQAGEPLERPAERVLLIGWDAADWRMIDPLLEAGKMPNLRAFLDGGVRGNVASLHPMLSPILWTSIATGKHADKHGILGFAEPDGSTGKVRPVTSTSRRCKALWNILSRRGLRSTVINWFASHPAERIRGVVVTDRYARPTGPPNEPWPGAPGSVHPEELAAPLEALRVHPGRLTAAQVRHFVGRVAEVNPGEDKLMQHLLGLLARCASIQSAATALIAEEPWDLFAVYFEEIDRFGHEFMEYHPPKRESVDQREFELYSGVMNAVYTFHDMMLGRLLELAGEETTVIILSDHGFHSDDRRPAMSSKIQAGAPVAWHRPYGVLAMRGPHIKRGEQLYGASLLDIAPTILAMLGQPVPDDMDGAPLTQVYERPVRVPRIDSYEAPGEEHDAPETEEDPWAVREMMVQLAQLGYVEDDSMESVARDRRRNLGQVYLATGRPLKALGEFRTLVEDDPDDKGSRMAVANCLLALGRFDECEALLEAVGEGDDALALALQYRGMISFRRGRVEEALDHLRRAEAKGGENPQVLGQIGFIYLARRCWTDAERAFDRALELDPDYAPALDGRGVAYRQQGKLQEAALSHMLSIALLHHQPDAHRNLGLALMRLGRLPWAVRAFETSLQINPHATAPHLALAQIYDGPLQRPDLAEHHRALAGAIAGRTGDAPPDPAGG
ncbi:MAG: alkaline phosphatase family protein [Phycisphaerales bacterium]|nr:alkaline phosphatase family protein [Phycisphaerales bacterium]